MLALLSRIRQLATNTFLAPPRDVAHGEANRQVVDSGQSSDSALHLPPSAFSSVVVLLASALGLYLEMVIVRWHSSCMHTFGVFKNVSMLSCFLGLGIGYAIASQRRSIRLHVVLPLLAIQCLSFAIISRTRLGRLSLNPIAEHYLMWQSDWRWWVEGLGGNLILAVTFVVNALMFVPIGQVTGRWMSGLPKLHGYALNLAGSLAGIGLFVLLSALWTPPVVWMSVAVIGLVPLLRAGRAVPVDERGPVPSLAVSVASLAVMLLAFGLIDRAGVQHFYSPYQTITCQLGPDSKYPCVARIMVNNASFQRVLNLSSVEQEQNSALRRIAQYYDLPYKIKPDARRVLVVGAGTGNDVAAALRASAHEVTAVEIDPTILFLGERLHPERPYADPRVRIVNDDARTFIRRTEDTFDMIVYGLLDSHTTLGSLTNVRLDSFVYTVEAFREAAARLNDDGLLTVTFAVMTPQQGKKLYRMLEEAFGGEPPRCFESGYDAGVMMLAGPAVARLPESISGVKELTHRFADPRLVAEVSTDDWPFFYMPRRTYPRTYAVMILLLLAISVALIAWYLGAPKLSRPVFSSLWDIGVYTRPNRFSLSPRLRGERAGVRGVTDWACGDPATPHPGPLPASGEREMCGHQCLRGEGSASESRRAGGEGSAVGCFFFLGAGFMLIETKAITQLGLVLGNTWQVLAVVVASILVLAFLANFWIMFRGPVARVTSFSLLVLSLLAGAVTTWSLSAGWQVPLPKFTLPLVLTLPLFFSGLIFSSELARGGELSSILACNLFGAMLGGFLEYNSMYWGYASLTWLGLGIYALAFLSVARPHDWLSRWRLTADSGVAWSSTSATPASA